VKRVSRITRMCRAGESGRGGGPSVLFHAPLTEGGVHNEKEGNEKGNGMENANESRHVDVRV
jgi:hypothetical protein